MYKKAQAEPSTPLIVYTEAQRLYGHEPSLAAVTPPGHALHIATRSNDPTAIGEVSYQSANGAIEDALQNPNRIFGLSNNNISTVHVAGEYGVEKGGGLRSACC